MLEHQECILVCYSQGEEKKTFTLIQTYNHQLVQNPAHLFEEQPHTLGILAEAEHEQTQEER